MIMWDYPTLPLDTNSSKVTALPTFPVTVADNTTPGVNSGACEG